MHISHKIKPSGLAKCLVISTLVVWASFAAADESASQQAPGNPAAVINTPELKPCYLKGLADRLECGSIMVAENPEKPQGKQIAIHFAVLPAIKNTYPNEALLAIAGGPGQSALENAEGFDRILHKVRQQRDILLIDQRGTGLSNKLVCEPESYIDPLAVDDTKLDTQKETLDCLNKQDADITQYGSLNALQDFEAVRQYLGYDKLHLYGISYGTRMAQLYMRHYGQHLATVTLDGVVPMQQSVLAIGQAIDRAFDKLIENCEQNTLCHQKFPQLKQDFEQVQATLTQGPVISQINDPLTGELTQLTMTLNKFMGTLRLALYNPSIRALAPHAIHQAAKGNFQPTLGLLTLTTDNLGIAIGMHSSVVCGEDWPRVTPEFRAKVTGSYFGKQMLEGFDSSCEIWKVPAVDASFSAPITSDIPTLLLSGELDPATPPSWGELATEKLSNAKHFVAPFATHGVAYQSCGNKLIAQLVDSGKVQELDESCLSKDVSRNFYLNASTVEAIPTAQQSTPQLADQSNKAQPALQSKPLNLNANKK